MNDTKINWFTGDSDVEARMDNLPAGFYLRNALSGANDGPKWFIEGPFDNLDEALTAEDMQRSETPDIETIRVGRNGSVMRHASQRDVFFQCAGCRQPLYIESALSPDVAPEFHHDPNDAADDNDLRVCMHDHKFGYPMIVP
jgi:hypothetical protein